MVIVIAATQEASYWCSATAVAASLLLLERALAHLLVKCILLVHVHPLRHWTARALVTLLPGIAPEILRLHVAVSVRLPSVMVSVHVQRAILMLLVTLRRQIGIILSAIVGVGPRRVLRR